MPFAGVRFLVSAAVIAAVSGCGGSGGGGSTGGGGGSSPTTVTFTFPGGAPPTVAAKIGSGSFTAQTVTGSTLSLSIPSDTSNFAVAYLCPVQIIGESSLATEVVREASVADGTSFEALCAAASPSAAAMGTLTGSLDASAIPGVESFDIDAQNSSTFLWQGTSGPTADFSLAFPSGSDRVLVLAYNTVFDGPLAAKNYTGQAVPGALNGGNPVVFGAADKTIPEAITYSNVPSGFGSPSTYILLETGGVGAFPYASEITTQYPALPAAAVESGDLYLLEARAYAPGLYGPGVFVETTSSGGPQSFTFPAPWNYAGPAPAAAPAFTLDYAGFAGKGNVLEQVILSWVTGSTTGFPIGYSLVVVTTANYQAGSTAIEVPDLSSLPGFLPAPASGTQVTWTAGLWQSTSGAQGVAPLGTTVSGVENYGRYAVP